MQGWIYDVYTQQSGCEFRNKLVQLQETCDNRPHKALKGIHRGKFSLRVAKHYRILYTFNRQTKEITISRIGHRSKIY